MNEFESEAMKAIHDLELKMTEGFAELRGDIKNLNKQVAENGKKVDKQTDVETKRLDKHSDEIDDLRDGYIELKTKSDNNWKWFLALAAWATAVAAAFALFT